MVFIVFIALLAAGITGFVYRNPVSLPVSRNINTNAHHFIIYNLSEKYIRKGNKKCTLLHGPWITGMYVDCSSSFEKVH